MRPGNDINVLFEANIRFCPIAMDAASNKNLFAFYNAALQRPLELYQPTNVD